MLLSSRLFFPLDVSSQKYFFYLPEFREWVVMSFFDWLQKLFGSASPEEQRPIPPRKSPEDPNPVATPEPQPSPTTETLKPSKVADPPARVSKTARAVKITEQEEPPKPPVSSVSGDALAMGELAPLSLDEAKSEAKASNISWRMSGGWDRRDRIPSLENPRTSLIDRAMIGHGLITAEELEEIHRVGAEMDELRPLREHALELARQQVAAEEQDKQKIKEEKKKEAARRAAVRQAEIELAKKTDIVYLGRGVSQGLANRQSNREQLDQLQLPFLDHPDELAKILEVEIPQLRWLTFHNEAAERTHYLQFEIPKKSGGSRILSAPHQALSKTQQWVLTNILQKLPTHEAAHGFVPGRSTVTHANLHVGCDLVAQMDLADFFPSITFPRVRGLFESFGYSPAIATILALLCTEAPRRTIELSGKRYYVAEGPRSLPQGACTSPALSNLIARKLDARLTGMSQKIGWTYSRYADDLTFSWKGSAGENGKQPNYGYLLSQVLAIIDEETFALNEQKTRIQRPSQRQQVTGIVVNDRPGVPRPVVRRLRAILHQAQKTGLAAQNRENHPHFAGWVQGMIAYISMVQPEKGKQLQAAFEQVPKDDAVN
ncbi:Retron-type RNA-directed DNA polymerase [Planctomycetales bacterium 10988]|nr:Retron-type RNA-directed DNA polymerase [Planctomycetales bacterium 10988]